MKDAAAELQASRKAPETMRRLVDRLLARRAELAEKKRKSNQGTAQVSIGRRCEADRVRGHRDLAEGRARRGGRRVGNHDR